MPFIALPALFGFAADSGEDEETVLSLAKKEQVCTMVGR